MRVETTAADQEIPMPSVDLTDAGTELSDTLNRVIDSQERVIVQRHGRPVAALVPIEDLDLLEQLEVQIDAEEARKILADPTEEYRPWEEVKAELGLQAMGYRVIISRAAQMRSEAVQFLENPLAKQGCRFNASGLGDTIHRFDLW
jgi:prevent-host-death family protein